MHLEGSTPRALNTTMEKRMKRVFLATAVAAAFATIGTSTVLAQSAEPDVSTILAQAAAPDASGNPRAGTEKRAFRSATERVEARLSYIHTTLKISDAQQTQWENFANVLRKHAREIDARIQQFRAQGAQRPDASSVNAIERLEHTQKRMAERYHRLGEVITAAKPLYEVLSPEQKQAADSMLARSGPGGHRHHHRGQFRGA
jgi:protein CpxP